MVGGVRATDPGVGAEATRCHRPAARHRRAAQSRRHEDVRQGEDRRRSGRTRRERGPGAGVGVRRTRVRQCARAGGIRGRRAGRLLVEQPRDPAGHDARTVPYPRPVGGRRANRDRTSRRSGRRSSQTNRRSSMRTRSPHACTRTWSRSTAGSWAPASPASSRTRTGPPSATCAHVPTSRPGRSVASGCPAAGAAPPCSRRPATRSVRPSWSA